MCELSKREISHISRPGEGVKIMIYPFRQLTNTPLFRIFSIRVNSVLIPQWVLSMDFPSTRVCRVGYISYSGTCRTPPILKPYISEIGGHFLAPLNHHHLWENFELEVLEANSSILLDPIQRNCINPMVLL